MIIKHTYRIVDGERIYCCRECKYIVDNKKCRGLNRKFEDHSHICPPNWCPYPEEAE
jgi:hypothetical protein